DGVDYVALGHIHGRQQLAPTVRYAGAPLHYSFGEGAKPRGSWLIDMDAAGEVAATWLDLPIPRRLVTLRATFDELLEAEDYEVHVDDWV
ncbi:MAG TPA: exonuclease sbcCD subunit D, partial [Microbacterium sp.]|nr:exonuclease sbcCD subunit D [Microbacterium sp.]